MVVSGGTIISELLSPKTGTAVEPGNIIAIIRKPEVAAKLQKKGIQVSDVSLTDEAAVESLVLDNEGESAYTSYYRWARVTMLTRIDISPKSTWSSIPPVLWMLLSPFR